jgi:YebC/PmpR family DNA-binding regulatory protein
MSGHSKWSTIKHQKGAADAKRAKVFAKLSREISIAVKVAGPEADMNPSLRMVLLKCRSANMPADNIQRAIKKASGEDGTTEYFELTYEVFGPHGVALLVNVATDNRNRSAAEIRFILSKNGGNMASSGSVSRLFDRKGQIIIHREDVDEDTLMEAALDAGAEDFVAEEEGFEIITDPASFEEVHKAIEAKNITCASAEVTSIPNLMAPVDADGESTVSQLIEALEDNDDVNDVYSNAEFP